MKHRGHIVTGALSRAQCLSRPISYREHEENPMNALLNDIYYKPGISEMVQGMKCMQKGE